MPCIWLGHIGEYHLCPLRSGVNTTFPSRPAASGDQDGIAPISQDSDGIPQYILARLTLFSQYVRARCMAFTLLLSKLKPHIQFICINS